jgi:uncharacterized protein YdbL (DUF1318 family)
MKRTMIAPSLFLGALIATALPAAAQERDPAYAAARAAGQVGELPDGYIGVVGAATKDLSALVNKINIQRKAVYTQRSAASGSTVEEMAFTTGCNLILKTASGEKYRDPTGAWRTRTAAAPTRDPRCV